MFSYFNKRGYRPPLINIALSLFASSSNHIHVDSDQFSSISAFLEYNHALPLGAFAVPYPAVSLNHTPNALTNNEEALVALACFLNQPIAHYYTTAIKQRPESEEIPRETKVKECINLELHIVTSNSQPFLSGGASLEELQAICDRDPTSIRVYDLMTNFTALMNPNLRKQLKALIKKPKVPSINTRGLCLDFKHHLMVCACYFDLHTLRVAIH